MTQFTIKNQILKNHFWNSSFNNWFLQTEFWKSIFEKWILKIEFWKSNFENWILKINSKKLNFKSWFLKIKFWQSNMKTRSCNIVSKQKLIIFEQNRSINQFYFTLLYYCYSSYFCRIACFIQYMHVRLGACTRKTI